MTKPDWFILIEQWIQRDMGQNGVTLPFIVGALAHKDGHTNLSIHHIRDILDDITQYPVDDYVTAVSWCPNINAPVLTTNRIDDPNRMQSSAVILRPSGKGESLIFGQNLLEWHGYSNDPVSCLTRLTEDATEPVLSGRFSRNQKDNSLEFEYGDFLPTELDYIQSTIMSPQQ